MSMPQEMTIYCNPADEHERGQLILHKTSHGMVKGIILAGGEVQEVDNGDGVIGQFRVYTIRVIGKKPCGEPISKAGVAA